MSKMKATYSDKLPRMVQNSAGLKCQLLSDDGERCGKKARYEVSVLEDPEIGYRWFSVMLCEGHTRDGDIKAARP